MLIGPNEISDAMRALSGVDAMNYWRVYWTLRSVYLSRRDEIPNFDSLFDHFWNLEPVPTRNETGRNPEEDLVGGVRELRPGPRSIRLPENDPTSSEMYLEIFRHGSSPRHVFSNPDLTVLRSDELSDMHRIAARLVRALSARPGRRTKPARRKGKVDLRQTMRYSLSTGGDPIRLPRRRRVPRVPRLMVILDVSSSMERYAQLLLQLIFAVYQRTKRIETFVFSTSVTRVTRELKSPSFGEALSRISRSVDHWSSGTKIGESLGDINARYEAFQDRFTTVFLLSDGWDTGDPEALANEVRRMQRRVRNIVWLNPLLGTDDYSPETRGLVAALPYVDQFVSARNVESLKRLPGLLRA